MSLNLNSILHSAGLDPEHVLVVRHAYAKDQKDVDNGGIHPDSTYEDILGYTSTQSQSPRSFPSSPPAIWVVFLPEGGDRARLWGVLQNRGEVARDELNRQFDLRTTNHLADLCNRLVIGWNSPRTWKVKGSTAANYPVLEIADAQPVPFPGFDWLVLSHPQLQAVMREHRYASWRTALASVVGIYLITDTRDGRQYVGKADGTDSIRQRWSAYAANGYGGNVELRNVDPSGFRYSILRVFDPATPTRVINEAESHFKFALDTRKNGLNRN